MIKIKKSLFLCFILFSLLSCKEDKKDETAFVQREVIKRVEDYRMQREAECRAIALERANILADSIIFAQAKNDTLSAMQRPIRPIRPTLKSPLDTTEVQPLLPKQE